MYFDEFAFDIDLFEKVVIFDDMCPGWTNSAESNLRYLTSMQHRYNRKLKEDGYVLLADIYAELGYDANLAYSWGWDIMSDQPWSTVYVDFGIYDIYQRKNREFVNGKNPDVILKFNAKCDLSDLLIDSYIKKNGEWCDYAVPLPLHIGGMHC